jgi:integrase
MKLNNCLDFWLATIKHTVAADTYERYQQELAHVRPYLGKMDLARLSALHVGQMLEKMEQDGLFSSKKRRALSRLRMALKHATQIGVVRTNVAAKVPLPKHNPEEMHPLTPEQMTTFLKKNRKDRHYALYVTALDSGARQGELFALDWSDWFPATGELVITKSLKNHGDRLEIKVPKTKASRRRILLSPETAAALEAHRARMAAEGHGSQHIFCDTRGGYLRKTNFHRNNYKPALSRAGLPDSINFHDLRHTCATLLLLAGVNVKLVADRLGHANPNVTLKTYSHVIPGMQQQAASAMSSYLSSSNVAVNEGEGEG